MLDLLKKRRSIRKYKDTPLTPEEIAQLVKAALLAPSSKSVYPWEFIVVTDKTILDKLSNCKKNSAVFLKDAPLGIVVLADETKSDVWVEDTSIASIIIQLMAQSLGLGSCWIQVRNRMHNETVTAEDYIKELLNIPANYKVECIIAVGYPDQERRPRTEESLKYDVVYENQYGQKYTIN
ncbi:MAG: NAD(P)H nitroreductase [Clostridia bacterium]|nr:NAD(P)H nitroreductase [Clostridia bacterium]